MTAMSSSQMVSIKCVLCVRALPQPLHETIHLILTNPAVQALTLFPALERTVARRGHLPRVPLGSVQEDMTLGRRPPEPSSSLRSSGCLGPEAAQHTAPTKRRLLEALPQPLAVNMGQRGNGMGAMLLIQRQWIESQAQSVAPCTTALFSCNDPQSSCPLSLSFPSSLTGRLCLEVFTPSRQEQDPAGLCPSPTSPVLRVFPVGSLVPLICKAWLMSPHPLEACPPGLLSWQLEWNPSKPCSLASVQGYV